MLIPAKPFLQPRQLLHTNTYPVGDWQFKPELNGEVAIKQWLRKAALQVLLDVSGLTRSLNSATPLLGSVKRYLVLHTILGQQTTGAYVARSRDKELPALTTAWSPAELEPLDFTFFRCSFPLFSPSLDPALQMGNHFGTGLLSPCAKSLLLCQLCSCFGKVCSRSRSVFSS